MNIKSAVIAVAVRAIADNTSLIPRNDPTSNVINAFFGLETPEQRAARELEADVDRLVAAVKRFRTNRKFKNITKTI